MLAHYHAQVWNGAELARAFAIAESTVKRYLDVLVNSFMVRVLPPWSENIGKRVVRTPKVYVADPGLLHALLDIPDARALDRHPKVGASFEGFALDQVTRALGARPEQCYFWATHQGAELDLLVVQGARRRGFEFTRTDAPGVTKSMRIALQDLGLESVDVVHLGPGTYPLAPGIRALAADPRSSSASRPNLRPARPAAHGSWPARRPGARRPALAGPLREILPESAPKPPRSPPVADSERIRSGFAWTSLEAVGFVLHPVTLGVRRGVELGIRRRAGADPTVWRDLRGSLTFFARSRPRPREANRPRSATNRHRARVSPEKAARQPGGRCQNRVIYREVVECLPRVFRDGTLRAV